MSNRCTEMSIANAYLIFFFQAEDGIRDDLVTGVQTCALPIFGDLIKKMTSLVKVAEAGKDAEKAPIIEAGNVVMGFFASVWDPIKKAHRELNDRMTKFGREKAEREKRERDPLAPEAEPKAARLADEP